MLDIKEDVLLEAIKGSHGIIDTIAKRIKVSWHTTKKYIEANEKTKQALDNERQIVLDIAESNIINAMKCDDPGISLQTSKWYMGLKGKDRGYSDKLEIGGEVNIKIIPAKKEDYINPDGTPIYYNTCES